MTDQGQNDQVRAEVRKRYGVIVRKNTGCCGGNTSCCGGEADVDLLAHGMRLGYSKEEVLAAPEGSNMSLGCGNPGAIASLMPGETVLDLGSGGGFDCFLAARQVGDGGQVIGVDMTPDMISKARENAAKAGFTNVEFRLGEIEHLPVADDTMDVIISNCVINLSPDKPSVFRDAYRVLKPGGRLAISDTVATAPLPEEARRDMEMWSECISGSASIDELEAMLREAGFEQIRIQAKDASREIIREWLPGRGIEDYVLSASIEAVKPGGSGC
jgi:arsenite methyltransferase